MQYGPRYAANAPFTSISAACDVFEIVAPALSVIIIHGVYLGQTTDVGDAQDEVLSLQFKKGTTSGSSGVSLSGQKLANNYVASGATIEALNTSQGSGGSVVHTDYWNVRAGYQYIPPPEQRIILSPNERLVIAQSAPADAITMGGTIIYEEIGG